MCVCVLEDPLMISTKFGITRTREDDLDRSQPCKNSSCLSMHKNNSRKFQELL